MSEIRYNKAIVKNINESLIRRCLQGAGSFTKTKIARETGLSFPTVSRILDEMTERGEILGGGIDPTTGGRHAQSYVLNPDFAYVLCIYFPQPTCMRLLMINSLGEVSEREDIPVASRTEGVKETMDRVIAEKMLSHSVKAISIGLPWGVSQGKILFGAKDTGLENYPLEAHLIEKFGISARVENDMNAAAAGCYTRMFGKDEKISLACISVTTAGCGCGLFVRGHLVRGQHGFAGELLYMAASPEQNMRESFHKIRDEGADASRSIAQMVSGICATVDPAYIVFYHRDDLPQNMKKIEDLCRIYLPEEVVPNLIQADSYEQDQENGLISFGMDLLLAGYEIINR
ncbi:MAG: ROK family transcriptional regulator [Firmicutes bacterium]|nr:ROK family transcriptional regulator [Bacillota bacterium]